MVQIDSLIFVFLIEALILLIAGLLLGAWLWSKRQHRENQAVDALIDRFQHTSILGSEELEDVLGEIHNLTHSQRTGLIEEILKREKALCRQILKLFFERDLRLLSQVNEQIRSVSEPYRQLLRDLPHGENPETTTKLQHAEQEIRHLQNEINHLTEKLKIALETIDRLSSEYTRLFAPDRTTEELEASRQRILKTLRTSCQRLQTQPALPAKDTDEDDDIIIVAESP